MHFLKSDEMYARALSKRWACVTVTLVGKAKLQVNPTIHVAKVGSLWCVLPSRVAVVDPEDREIEVEPGMTFFVTAESFNPCHLLLMIEPRGL